MQPGHASAFTIPSMTLVDRGLEPSSTPSCDIFRSVSLLRPVKSPSSRLKVIDKSPTVHIRSLSMLLLQSWEIAAALMKAASNEEARNIID